MGRERRNLGTKGFSRRGKEGRGRPAHHPRRHASCLYRCYCDGRRPLLAERRLTAFAPSPYLPLPLPQPPSALPLYAGHYDECCSLLAERKRVLSSQLVSRLKTSVSACLPLFSRLERFTVAERASQHPFTSSSTTITTSSSHSLRTLTPSPRFPHRSSFYFSPFPAPTSLNEETNPRRQILVLMPPPAGLPVRLSHIPEVLRLERQQQ